MIVRTRLVYVCAGFNVAQCLGRGGLGPPRAIGSPGTALLNEQPRSKLRGIEHPSLNSFRGKPRGIEPEEIEKVTTLR